VKLARKLGPGHTVVTIICDGGDRNWSKLYNSEWMRERGLEPKGGEDDTLAFVL
jgi:cysteine synthase A